MKPWAWRLAKGIGAALAIALLVSTALDAWRQLSTSHVRLAPGPALAALALLVATYIGLADLWRRAAGCFGVRLKLGEAIQVWSFSNLGRYIPGKVWQVIGLVVVARDFGVSALAAAGVAVLVTAMVIGAGALVGIALLPRHVAGSAASLAGVALAAIGMVVIVAWPGMLLRLASRVPGASNLKTLTPPSRGAMASLSAGFCAAWIGHGVAFFLFAGAFAPLAWDRAAAMTGAYSLAHVLGLVAIVAPGGIGVREEVLERLVGGIAGEALPASVVAVAARVWTTAAEVVVLLIAIALRLARRRAIGRGAPR